MSVKSYDVKFYVVAIRMMYNINLIENEKGFAVLIGGSNNDSIRPGRL